MKRYILILAILFLHIQSALCQVTISLDTLFISNVVDKLPYIDKDGNLVVFDESKEQGPYINVSFTIENNGPCIPEYILPVIFDPGYTTKFNENGIASTGIGLSHVQTIAYRLEGTITVSSNETTIFTITIPTYKLR